MYALNNRQYVAIELILLIKIFFENSKFGQENSAFLENLNEHKYNIGYNRAGDEPKKLIKRASQTFDAIKTNHKAFSQPEEQNLVEELGEKVFATLQKKSPLRILSFIISQLESIDFDKVPENEIEEIKVKAKEISKICYPIYK